MNGKDLLAVAAMIGPAFLLVVLFLLTPAPASVLQPFPGGGEMRGKPAAPKTVAVREVPAVPAAAPHKATQKRLRDPWERQSYAGVP